MKSNQFSIKNVSNHLFSSEVFERARLPFVTIEWIQTRRPDLLVDTQIYEWSIDSQDASHVNMQQAIALPFIYIFLVRDMKTVTWIVFFLLLIIR